MHYSVKCIAFLAILSIAGHSLSEARRSRQSKKAPIENNEAKEESKRRGKGNSSLVFSRKECERFSFLVFSLFSVVQFKNDPCPSSQAGRNGTCFTSSECESKGGSSQGGCAAG